MPLLSITMPFQGEREIKFALSLLTVVNVMQLHWHKQHGPLPPIYKSGVRYERESAKRRTEDWLSIEQVIAQRAGDCEDLACWRAAELIVKGEHARAIPMRTRGGWHIVVRRADGSTEDPSRVLGMQGERGRRDEVAALYARYGKKR